MILFFLLVFLCFVFVGIFVYTTRFFIFSGNPIAQIMFHVIVQIDGADSSFLIGIAKYCIIAPFVVALVATIIFYNKKLVDRLSRVKLYSFCKKYCVLFAGVCLLISFLACAKKLELKDYIDTYTKSTTIYEDEYVDPKNVDISFPEKKRNLIYIILESAETTDYAIDEGGAFEKDIIPELHEIASENDTFNDNKGFYVAPNTGWTVGALIGQHSGAPVIIPLGENDFVTSNKFSLDLLALEIFLKRKDIRMNSWLDLKRCLAEDSTSMRSMVTIPSMTITTIRKPEI